MRVRRNWIVLLLLGFFVFAIMSGGCGGGSSSSSTTETENESEKEAVDVKDDENTSKPVESTTDWTSLSGNWKPVSGVSNMTFSNDVVYKYTFAWAEEESVEINVKSSGSDYNVAYNGNGFFYFGLNSGYDEAPEGTPSRSEWTPFEEIFTLSGDVLVLTSSDKDYDLVETISIVDTSTISITQDANIYNDENLVGIYESVKFKRVE